MRKVTGTWWLLAFELVAYATRRDQVTRALRVRLDLGAQPTHVDSDLVGVSLIIISPDEAQDLFMAEDAASIACQHVQQEKLDGRQLHVTSARQNHPVIDRIEAKVAHLKRCLRLPEREP